jgi:hypothetical protein
MFGYDDISISSWIAFIETKCQSNEQIQNDAQESFDARDTNTRYQLGNILLFCLSLHAYVMRDVFTMYSLFLFLHMCLLYVTYTIYNMQYLKHIYPIHPICNVSRCPSNVYINNDQIRSCH